MKAWDNFYLSGNNGVHDDATNDLSLTEVNQIPTINTTDIAAPLRFS